MIFATAEPQHIFKPYPFEIEVEEKFLISDVDPLVLSCCQYRHNDPTAEDYDDIAAYAWVNGNLSYLYGKVTQADHDLANNIRTHFRGKILVSKICGNEMSKFRQDLATYLDIEWNPNVQISTIYRGMIYKLPYFYHNDLILANEIFTTKHQGITKPQTSWNKVTLTYIRSIEERKKKKLVLIIGLRINTVLDIRFLSKRLTLLSQFGNPLSLRILLPYKEHILNMHTIH
jgi:hypothetical protein